MSADDYPLNGSCPCCGHHFDLAAPLIGAGRGPRPGDCTMCIGCAGLLRITPTGIEALTTAEIDGLPSGVRFQLELAKSFLKAAKARRKAREN